MITIQDVKNYTLLDIDPSFDSAIEQWIVEMTAHIESLTRRDFTPDETASERLFDGNGRDTLLIDDFSDVETVEVNDREVTCLLYPANTDAKNTLYYAGGFTKGRQNISVNAIWGINPPSDIKHACTVLVGGVVRSQSKTTGDIVKEKIGNYDVSYSDRQGRDLELAMKIISNHKRYVI